MRSRRRALLALVVLTAALHAVAPDVASAGIGARDTAYGVGGERHVDLDRGAQQVMAVDTLADGRIAVVAIAERHATPPSTDVVVGMAVSYLTAGGDPIGSTRFTRIPDWPRAGDSSHSEWPGQARVLSDGSILAAVSGNAIVRVLPDGTLDPSYGQGGVARPPLVGGRKAYAYSFDLLPDGTAAVVVGRDFSGSRDALRLGSDGRPDPAFGSGGLQPLPWGAYPEVTRFAAGPLGTLYVAHSDFEDGAVQRWRPDGTVDLTFALGTFPVAAPIRDIEPVALGGIDILTGPSHPRVTRVTALGLPDPTFGLLGTSPEYLPYGGDTLAEQVGGGVIVTFDGGRPARRLTSLGQPDEEFAFRVDPRWELNAIETLADGRLVVAGSQSNGGTDLLDALGVLGLDGHGAIDPAFGEGGATTLRVATGGQDQYLTSTVDGLGRATIVGRTGDGWAVTRLLPTGHLDPAYGTGGVANVDGDVPADVIVLGDGSVAGLVTRWDGTGSQTGIVRLDPLGRPLAGWGTGGTLVYPDDLVDLVELPAARLAVGDTRDRIHVLLPDGTLDPTFGEDGTIDVPSGVSALAFDGTALLSVGSSYDSHAFHAGVARFTLAGAPDASWGSNGVAVLPSDLVPRLSETRLAIGPGRSVLVASCSWVDRLTGSGTPVPSARIAVDGCIGQRPVTSDPAGRVLVADRKGVHRHLTSGAPDTSFGDDGLLVLADGEVGTAFDLGARLLLLGQSADDLWSLALLAGAPPGIPTVSLGQVTVTEGDVALVPITLDRPGEAPVEVVIATRDVSGQLSLDVDASRAVVPRGATAVTLAMPTREDKLTEDTERTSLVITEVSQGEAGANGRITILDDDLGPDVPSAPTAHWLGADTRLLSISQGAHTGASHNTGYSVVITRNGQTVEWLNTPGGAVTTVTLPQLVAGRAYEVRVLAWNAHGVSAPSGVVAYTPPAPKPEHVAPANWAYSPAHHAEGLYLQWYAGSGGAPISGYSVIVTEAAGTRVLAWRNFGASDPRDTLVTGLPRNRDLQAWLVTWRADGTFQVWSDPVLQLDVQDGAGRLGSTPAATKVELTRQGGAPAVVWDLPASPVLVQAVSVVVTRGNDVVSWRTYTPDRPAAPLVPSEITGGAKVTIVTWTVLGPAASTPIRATWPS